MSGVDTHSLFEPDWLTLREPADHASRSAALSAATADWFAGLKPSARRIVDLGSGLGSNLHYLAPRLPGPQHWRLVDHDARLLDAATQRSQALQSADHQAIHIDCEVADLRTDPSAVLGDAALVTAAALFDLVSASWIERLVAACAARRAAALFVLSVDGTVGFERRGETVEDPDDRRVFAWLAAHQRRDKGFGEALGSNAPAVLIAALERAGYRVHAERSRWTLGADNAALAAMLVEGWRRAAIEQAHDQRVFVDAWAGRRIADLRAGRIAAVVGHYDVYAEPSALSLP